jgi:ABC-type nitrate/sulfonate/bicarbonate transport system substrate-binding protein
MYPWVKVSLFAVLPLAATLCLAPVASADHDEWRGNRYEDQISAQDLRSFENYLDAHRETAQQLYQNPDLLRDRRFVRSHDALQDWLNDHPDAAETLQANPHQYLGREQASPAGEPRQARARMSERDLRSFENYLDAHEETARTLYQNPELINDQRFVRNHEALHDWMENHPDAVEALRANPNKYLWRERSTDATDFLNQLFGARR